jgi:DNA-binding XRE family transcriptional regulator
MIKNTNQTTAVQEVGVAKQTTSIQEVDVVNHRLQMVDAKY